MIKIEIEPADFTQFVKGRNGQMIEIPDDVGGVAAGLRRIDHHLRLRFSEKGGYFVVYWKPDASEPGDGYLVFTAQELDARIVKRMEEVHHRCTTGNYSFIGELEAREKEAANQADHEWTEAHGEMFEKLAFAMRKDLGYDQSSISTYVPEAA